MLERDLVAYPEVREAKLDGSANAKQRPPINYPDAGLVGAMLLLIVAVALTR